MPPAAAPPVPRPHRAPPPLLGVPTGAVPALRGGGVIPARPRHGGLRQMSGIEDDEL